METFKQIKLCIISTTQTTITPKKDKDRKTADSSVEILKLYNSLLQNSKFFQPIND